MISKRNRTPTIVQDTAQTVRHTMDIDMGAGIMVTVTSMALNLEEIMEDKIDFIKAIFSCAEVFF